MVNVRFAVLAAALALTGLPAGAADRRGPAPADEYFGHARMSVLGIGNTIRDARSHLDEGRAPQPIVDGPLAFASDAIRDWQSRYPNDNWIPRNLYALEVAYVHARPYGMEQARRTEAWLVHDYPQTAEAGNAAIALNDTRFAPVGTGAPAQNTADAWLRYAAMRVLFPH